jgi:SagB-type dehydrogenase family enzyme
MATAAGLLPAAGGGEPCWELFHENSKLGRIPPRRTAAAQATPAADFFGCPAFELPAAQPFELLADAVVIRPRPIGIMRPGRIWRDTLAALLLRSLGREGGGAAPSAVEIWFHAASIDGMPAGLYRFDGASARVLLIRAADLTGRLAAALPEPDLATRSALQLFIVADLARLAARYGERGYRYALVEAGRLARDLDLVATALGLLAITTGEFRDREIDALFGLDGLATSALLMVAVGKTGRGAEQREPAKLGSLQRGRRRRRRGRR